MNPLLTVAEMRQLPTNPATRFEGVLLLRRLQTRRARNGSEFLTAEFGDRTGSFSSAVVPVSSLITSFQTLQEGDVVRVTGWSGIYQDRFSPRFEAVERMAPEECPDLLDGLLEKSPIPLEELQDGIAEALEAIAHHDLRATVESALAEAGDGFVNGPAAVSMHHAYRHGLLEHTVRMARAARALLPLYPEISPDLALAGILLHDIGKTLEYQAGMSTRRSRLGILQGHVVLGYRIVRRAGLRSGLDPDLLERLEHIILSHQGELEWGAAAMAATPEAVFVSMVDNLDARMGMVQQALRQSQPGGDPFSEYLPGLKAPLLTQAPPASPTLEDNLE